MEKLEHLLLNATLWQLKDAAAKRVEGPRDSSPDLSPLDLLEPREKIHRTRDGAFWFSWDDDERLCFSKTGKSPSRAQQSSDQYSSTIKPTNLPDASVSNAICGSSPVHYASYHPLWTRRHIYLQAQFYVACVFLSDVPSQALVVSVKPSQMPSSGTNTMSKASFTESSILYPHLQGAGHASVLTEPVFGRCYRCLLSASPNCDYDCIIMNHHHRSR